MAESKTRTSHLAGVSTTQNSTWQDLSTSYDVTVGLSIANGATGPTTAAQFQIQVANDYNAGSPTNPVNYGGPLVGPTSNSGASSWGVEISDAWQAVRVQFTAASGGSTVTGTADTSKTTAI